MDKEDELLKIIDAETIEDFRCNRFNEYDTFYEHILAYVEILDRNGYTITRKEQQ